MIVNLRPDEIKAFRDEHGLSQRELAEMTGAATRTIEDWEAGRRQAPDMLRVAMSAVRAGLKPWHPTPAIDPKEMDSAAAMAFARERVEQAAADWAEQKLDWIYTLLGDRDEPADALLLAQFAVGKDGYCDIEAIQDWNARPKTGWTTVVAYRPEVETGAVPTFAFQMRYDDEAQYLAVFVDRAQTNERLLERIEDEGRLLATGWRVMRFSAFEVLTDPEGCYERISSLVFDLNESNLIKLGHVQPRKSADRQRISLSEDYEVRDWAQKFGVSEERLRNVVDRVGTRSADVREALKR